MTDRSVYKYLPILTAMLVAVSVATLNISCKKSKNENELKEDNLFSNFFGGSKEGLGPKNSKCNQVLTKAKQGKFGKLFSCAEKRSCVTDTPTLSCIFCKDNAQGSLFGYYRYPYPVDLGTKPSIKICENAIKTTDLKNYEEGLLEEAYHAVSICAKGNPATESLNNLRKKLLQEKVSYKSTECRVCLAMEMLAKHCAKGHHLNPPSDNPAFAVSNMMNNFTAATSSCQDLCPTNYDGISVMALKKHPSFLEMKEYYPTMRAVCQEMDQNCQAE